MGIHAYSATYIIVKSDLILKDHALIVSENTIIAHCSINDLQTNYPTCIHSHFPNAILCAGFINTHTHLELSCISKIEKFNSFFDWVRLLNSRREALPAEEQFAKNIAVIEETVQAGTIAFGDISNTGSLIDYLNAAKIDHHTFIEVLGFHSAKADEIWHFLNTKFEQHLKSSRVSLSPHALYSVSKSLLERMANSDKLLSIHVDELASETTFLDRATGEIAKFLHAIHAWDENWHAPQLAPHDYIESLGFKASMLHVHNLQTNSTNLLKHKDKHFILCPRSNYILHKKQPQYSTFQEHDIPFALGTDSLASNNDLSILNEMKYLHKNSKLSVEQIYKAGTETGARFLNFHQLGTLDVGKAASCNLYRFGVLSANPIKQLLDETALEHKLLRL
jgi:cytosine/adenosine deaminase-related metal-dependent hydrolase